MTNLSRPARNSSLECQRSNCAAIWLVTILLDAATERDLAPRDASIAREQSRERDVIALVRAHHPRLTEEETRRHDLGRH
jgi:hypothetical protein